MVISIFTAISMIGGLVVGIGKMFNKIAKRFETVEDASKYRKEENIVLIKATLAICEGLIQQGCNGPVTKCKYELQEYLIKRGE
jgi:hypothetical protein